MKHVAICLVTAAAISLSACSKSDDAKPAGPAAAAADAATTFVPSTYLGVTFDVPEGWKAENKFDQGGKDYTAPAVDGNWAPDLFFEVNADRDERDLASTLDRAVAKAEKEKPGFALTEKKTLTHPHGFQYGRLEYTNKNDETPLTRWELVIPLDGEKRLYVHASAATSTWPRYQPIFAKVIDSIRLPRSSG